MKCENCNHETDWLEKEVCLKCNNDLWYVYIRDRCVLWLKHTKDWDRKQRALLFVENGVKFLREDFRLTFHSDDRSLLPTNKELSEVVPMV